MKNKIMAILEQCLSIDDEFGGLKIAEWEWRSALLILGIEDAAEEIAKIIPEKEKCIGCVSSLPDGKPGRGDFSPCGYCSRKKTDNYRIAPGCKIGNTTSELADPTAVARAYG